MKNIINVVVLLLNILVCPYVYCIDLNAFLKALCLNDIEMLLALIDKEREEQNNSYSNDDYCNVRYHPYMTRSKSKKNINNINDIVPVTRMPGPWGDVIGGYNLIQIAARYSNRPIIQALINHGANLNFGIDSVNPYPQNKCNRSPLYLSCLNNNLEGVRTLIENHGAYLFTIDSYKSFPCRRYNLLHFAIRRKKVELVDLLLTLCPVLAEQFDSDGDTPLHTAIEKCKFNLVVPFVRHRCNLSILNAKCSSPLQLAKKKDLNKMTEYLSLALSTLDTSNNCPSLHCQPYTLQTLATMSVVRHCDHDESVKVLPPTLRKFIFGISSGKH